VSSIDVRIDASLFESLPPLAWSARVRRGDEKLVLDHGAWVEVRSDAFFEGAWDGAFEEGRFGSASMLVGSGGRIEGADIVFSAASGLLDRIYVMARPEEVLVSNSLAFLLAAADDEPDADQPFYAGRLLEQALLGTRRSRRALPMRRGTVQVFEAANLRVTPDLVLRREERRSPAEPQTYEAYVDLVSGTIRAVLENAADPRRVRPFRPLATLSRGYDSTAIAALAARSGCTQAVTFDGSPGPPPNGSDNGKAIGVHLGMEVEEYNATGYRRRPGIPEAEFCVHPPGWDVVFASMEDKLPGRLLLTGWFGDESLTTEASGAPPDLRHQTIRGLSGTSLSEFRLRVGFLNFSPLFVAAPHVAAVHRISRGDAMRPWRLGGSYDRPIARRILEEAGVARELFGQQKMGGAYQGLMRAEHLGEAGRADFAAFCETNAPGPGVTRRARWARSFERRVRRAAVLAGHNPGHPLPQLARFSRRLEETLLFRWGVHSVRTRYALPRR